VDPIRVDHPLRRWFSGLVEQAFCTDVGLCAPVLTDYMADLLVNFTYVDRLNAIRNAQGRELEQIATMLAIASDERPTSPVERDCMIYRHIGDFTLFWAGVYPEQIRRGTRDPSDVLMTYVARGKRSYSIVSDLAEEDARPPASLFRHLSEDFESCVHGLGLVRRFWEHRDPLPPNPSGELIL